jgi:hypothetical protein
VRSVEPVGRGLEDDVTEIGKAGEGKEGLGCRAVG